MKAAKCDSCKCWFQADLKSCPFCGAANVSDLQQGVGLIARLGKIASTNVRNHIIQAKRCMGCMELFRAELNQCPKCGWAIDAPAVSLLNLNPGTLLKERYVVGKGIDFNSFSCIYIGWDCMLDRKVRIEEYCPSQYATRFGNENELIVANNQKKQASFTSGLRQFLTFGNNLIQVNSVESIEHYYDCFEANKTAYIIAEYLEGETLKTFLDKHDRLSEKQIIEMMTPLLQALNNIHEKGVIHKNISPESILLSKDENGKYKVKLFNFISVLLRNRSQSQCNVLFTLNTGYAPEEQYRFNAALGPYTDVYSVAAIMYHLLTGARPPDVLERLCSIEQRKKDTLIDPWTYDHNISMNFDVALQNALSIKYSDRTLSANELLNEMTQAGNSTSRHDTTWHAMSRLEQRKWKARKW